MLGATFRLLPTVLWICWSLSSHSTRSRLIVGIWDWLFRHWRPGEVHSEKSDDILRSFDFIVANPWVTLKQMLFSASRIWWVQISPVNADSFNSQNPSGFMIGLREWSYTLSFSALLAFGAWGVCAALRDRSVDLWLLVAYFAAGTALAMLFSPVTRYRSSISGTRSRHCSQAGVSNSGAANRRRFRRPGQRRGLHWRRGHRSIGASLR